MQTTTSKPTGSRVIDVLAICGAVLTVAGVGSFVVRGAPFEQVFNAWIFHNAPLGAFMTIGMAAALRRDPTNRAARYLFASALFSAAHVATISLAYALIDQLPEVGAGLLAGDAIAVGELPWTVLVPLWFSGWLWVVSAGLSMVWGLPLAPDGRWPSPRWRWIERVGAVGILAFGLAWAIRPLQGATLRLNEIGDAGLVAQMLFVGGGTVLGVAGLGSVAAVVARLRSTDPARGQQPRPVAWVILTFLLAMVLLYPWQRVWAVTTAVAMVVLIATLTFAIASHHLFDVEVFVGRAVTAALLAAFVTVAYVGMVAGVGWLIGDRENLALALVATAVVAVGFEPLRRRTATWVRRVILGVRSTPAEVLANLSDRLARADSTDEVLAEVADLLVAGTGGVAAQIRVPLGPNGWEVVAGASAPPADAVVRAAEVVNEGERLGEVRVFAEREDHLAAGDDRLLRQVADTLGPVLRNAALTRELTGSIAELRASRERLVMAEDAARRAVERDIHDGAQQQLLALRLKLGLAMTLAEDADDRTAGGRVRDLVTQAANDTDAAIRALRQLARGLYPPILQQQGLGAALRACLRDVPLETSVTDDGVGRHAPGIETAVYLCCVEAIQNATKHSGASRVSVTLRMKDEVVSFAVTDDGCGFDVDAARRAGGTGLSSMADRVEAIGGRLTLRSQPRGGTEVCGAVPVGRDERSGQESASAK